MNRSEFLKSVGAGAVAAVIPVRGHVNDQDTKPFGVDCVLIPQETVGPFPLDLSGDVTKFRQDVTEGMPGAPLYLILTIVNINDNCKPIPNARVDIWHTDKDGVYSGFNQPGANTVGQTFMRGIQISDANGQVKFRTIYPGWYPGRITHIHFQVFMNSVLSATSQMAFPEDITQQVYDTALYANKGQNTTVANNISDGVFASPANSLQYEMLSIVSNEQTGIYTGTMTIGISAPVSGIRDLEPETGRQFVLKQNHPNPCTESTSIDFFLSNTSHVILQLFDTNARSIGTIYEGKLDKGEHTYRVQRSAFGDKLPEGTYLYQLTVTNNMGRFSQVKAMTVGS